VLIVAFIITAFVGVMLGIWLSARAASSQMPGMNPARLWAFIDVLKKRTIEAYSAELTSALRLKYPDDASVSAEMAASFIDEYTADVLEHQTTRR
jgi:hypothetical protein